MKIKLLELFGGIGACSKALDRLGIDYEIADYVEIDKYAVASYNAIHNTQFEPQDICKWDKDIKVDLIMHGSPCQDFSVAGKGAGGDEGSGTRSSLMYETIRIVNKLKPKYVLWENVKNLLSKKHIHNFKNYISIMNELGYNSYYQVLNSKNYGIPQNRERVFTLSIRQDIDNGTFTFPEPIELKLKLKDMLEDEVDEKYYLSEQQYIYICGNAVNGKLKDVYDRKKALFNKDISYTINTKQDRRIGDTNYIAEGLGEITCEEVVKFKGSYGRSFGSKGKLQKEVADTLTSGMGEGGGNIPLLKIKNNTKQGYLSASGGDGIYTNTSTKRGTVQKQMIPALTSFQDKGVVLNDLRIRKLTPKECWRLMGFTDQEFDKAQKVNSNAQLYKQAGNSIVVNVLEKILEQLLLKDENDFEGQITFEMI